MTATITSKGQLVMPKSIRDLLHVGPGDKVDFAITSSGDVVVRPATVDVRSLRGCLARRGRKPVSIAQMNAAIHRRAAKPL